MCINLASIYKIETTIKKIETISIKQEGPGQAQEVDTWQSHEVQHGQVQGPASALPGVITGWGMNGLREALWRRTWGAGG